MDTAVATEPARRLLAEGPRITVPLSRCLCPDQHFADNLLPKRQPVTRCGLPSRYGTLRVGKGPSSDASSTKIECAYGALRTRPDAPLCARSCLRRPNAARLSGPRSTDGIDSVTNCDWRMLNIDQQFPSPHVALADWSICPWHWSAGPRRPPSLPWVGDMPPHQVSSSSRRRPVQPSRRPVLPPRRCPIRTVEKGVAQFFESTKCDERRGRFLRTAVRTTDADPEGVRRAEIQECR